MLWSSDLVVKFEVERYEELLTDLFSFFVLRLKRHLPKRIHPDKFLKLEHLNLTFAEI